MIKLHDGIYNQNLIHYIKLNKFNVQSTEMSTRFQKLQKNHINYGACHDNTHF